MIDKIKSLSAKYFQEIVSIRKHLHKNPELSFEEFNTSQYIKQLLDRKEIPYDSIANTGIVATILPEKSTNKKSIAIRAELDALPITEQNTHDFVSKNKGVMHACGHDVHMASLIGTAYILNDLKADLKQPVKVTFQPGEEKLPGGASILLKEGLVETHNIDKIIAQHVAPSLPSGHFGFREGVYMASCDEIYINIVGKGGHGALPHTLVDPVLISAHLITALQQIVSRKNNPTTASVLSFGKVIANGATNVIPDNVLLEGTFRTFNEQWRYEAHQHITSLCENIARSMGGKAEINIAIGYPSLINSPKLSAKCKTLAKEYTGEDNIVDLDLRMTSEDFAFYSQKIESCFYRMGVANTKKGIVHPVHSSLFDIDEKALVKSVGLMAWLTINS